MLYRKLVIDAEYTLSPIDRHVMQTALYSDWAGLFHPSYGAWRVKRCNKILDIYGIDFFKDRKILELGCGHGDIGAFFAELGAQVLGLDGRQRNVTFARLKHRNVAGIRFEQFNLEDDFSGFGRFDLIINFGLIYHLRDINAHLRACFSCADDLVMETVVCDSTDPYKVTLCDEKKLGTPLDDNESSIKGIGCLPSPFFIERVATENGFRVDRHFTPDLNAGVQFNYDWSPKNDGRLGEGLSLRRFWRFVKDVDGHFAARTTGELQSVESAATM
jgi:SAM-dependent methyltransferase